MEAMRKMDYKRRPVNLQSSWGEESKMLQFGVAATEQTFGIANVPESKSFIKGKRDCLWRFLKHTTVS